MNRREQNQALKQLGELTELVITLRRYAPEVIVRGSFGTGQFIAPRSPHDPMAGIPPPSYRDETGEHATSVERPDKLAVSIRAMSDHVSRAIGVARYALSVVPDDVVERAARNIPDCRACCQPVEGRVVSGYCRRCYNRWVYLGRPDRVVFERDQQATPENDSNTYDLRRHDSNTASVYN